MSTFPQKFAELKKQKKQIDVLKQRFAERYQLEGATDELKDAREDLLLQIQKYEGRKEKVENSLTSKIEADAKLSMSGIEAVKSAIDGMMGKAIGFATLFVGLVGAFYGKWKAMVHDWQYPDQKYGGVQRNPRERKELRKVYNKEVSPDKGLDPIVVPVALASTNQYNQTKHTPDQAANYDGMNDNFVAPEAPSRPNGTTGPNNGHSGPTHN